MATEKRLISLDTACDMLNRFLRNASTNEEKSTIFEVKQSLLEMGRVDAVEVVRCKDCKHRGEEGCCPMYFVDEIEWDDDGYIEVDYVPHDYTVDDGFCDRGERRTNERKAD